MFHAMVSALSKDEAENKFKEKIRKYFNIKNVFLVSSGKAAIYLTLLGLEQISKRREVIIPAYSSFCLASAVARTGLSINLCDIDPDTLDFDLSKLQSLITEKTLAVIPVHNYGLVCNLKEIKKLTMEKGVYVVEDAAQAAGALFENRKVGTIGDVGILSLGRGKNICALGGGVILTDKEPLAELIVEALEKYPKESLFSDMASFVTGAALSLLLNPERYAIPANLLFLNLGANIFDPSFKITRFPNLNAGVGQQIFLSLDRYNEIRIQNARLLNKNLNGTLKIPKPNPDGRPVYLRFPILFQNKETREKAFVQLNQKRLGTNRSYPTPLSQIVGFRKYLAGDDDFPGAQFVSDRILTLPTHPYVTQDDIEKIVSAINHLVSCKL
jgi:dTDP-4-amino-4,6-dideoxygalactose transaminase